MHQFRILAATAATVVAIAIGPTAMAATTPDQPAALQLVRGGGGFHGGGHGLGGHVGGFRGGHAWRGGARYHTRNYGYLGGAYPYVYGCPYPYPYSYPYCTFPNG